MKNIAMALMMCFAVSADASPIFKLLHTQIKPTPRAEIALRVFGYLPDNARQIAVHLVAICNNNNIEMGWLHYRQPDNDAFQRDYRLFVSESCTNSDPRVYGPTPADLPQIFEDHGI